MYKMPFEVTTTNADASRRLGVAGLFRLFQDAAIEDSKLIGYGVDKMMSKGLLWVFSRVHVHIKKMPEYLSNATFVTYPIGKKAFLFPRYAKVLSEQGETLGEISSVWALINEETRRVEMHPDLDDANQAQGDEMPLPGKVVARPVKYAFSKRVSFSDLDINRHLNNVKYIEMILDINEPSFYKDHRISDLLIQYESEIRAGESVDIMVDENHTYVRGVVDDRIAFEANLEYSPLEA